MPADLDVNVPATTRGLQAALEALDAFCDGRGVDSDVARRARVVVEELFTNTIKYGYGGACERPVRLSGRFERALTLVFEDEGPPFDLTLWTPPQQAPGERVGQQGIAMVMGLCGRVVYERAAQFNRITLEISAGWERRRPVGS
jgi:serine/threonine-protein kinase RsbW